MNFGLLFWLGLNCEVLLIFAENGTFFIHLVNLFLEFGLSYIPFEFESGCKNVGLNSKWILGQIQVFWNLKTIQVVL